MSLSQFYTIISNKVITHIAIGGSFGEQRVELERANMNNKQILFACENA